MTTSLDLLIRQSVRCTKCGEPYGSLACSCWVTIQCPTCHRTTTDERKPEDAGAPLVMLECPDCIDKPKPKKPRKTGTRRVG